MMQNILIIGDSHVRETFLDKRERYNKRKGFGIGFVDGISIISVSASTISGLINQTSKTKTNKMILDYLKLNKVDVLVLKFGQVDIEYVYDYKRKKDNKIQMEQFQTDLIKKYREFILLIKKFVNEIVIIGLYPSVLSEDKLVYNMNFNRKLKTLSQWMNIKYLDYSKYILESNTNNVNPRFIHQPIDSHLELTIEDKILFTKMLLDVINGKTI